VILVLALLFAVAVAAVFAAMTAFSAVIRLVRPAGVQLSADDGRTLARAVAASRPPQDWEGRLDRSFDRMVRWTLLGLTAPQASATLLLSAALGGAACFFIWGDLLAVVLGMILGASIPFAVLLALQHRWRLAVQAQLPDGLFLLARSLRAGLSLEQALGAVRSYCPRPLEELFGRCAEQIELGLAAPEALQRMAEATNLPDMRALAATAVLHRDVGGHLPTLIDRLATGVRDRNQFRHFFRAATALSRVTAVFLAAAPPVIGLFLSWDQPELFQNFFASTLGWMVFGAAILLEIIGIIWLLLLLRRDDY